MAKRSVGGGMFLALFALAAALAVSAPRDASAMGKTANSMCKTVFPQCAPCSQVWDGKECVPGLNQYMCPGTCYDLTAGGTTVGQCLAVNLCQGLSYSASAGQKGGETGLSQLAQALGQLLGSLMAMHNAQQSQQPATSGYPTATGCMGQYYQTSDLSRVGVDPCAQYVPQTTQAVTPITTGTGSCDSLSASLGLCGNANATNPLNLNTNTVGNAGISSTSAPAAAESQTGVVAGGATSSCPLTIVARCPSGYQSAPAIGADLQGCPLPPWCVPAASSTAPYGGTASSSCPTGFDVLCKTGFKAAPQSGTDLQGCPLPPRCALGSSARTLLAATSGPFVAGIALVSTTTGDITQNGGGATTFGQTTDLGKNTTVAGFIGSDVFGGAHGLVAGWCEARPWASNFLSSFIPPSFFDGLCALRGYQVGPPPAPAPAFVTQAPRAQTPPAPKPAAASTTPAVAPAVRIWAVPSAVPLDGRAEIFWTTAGVSSCTETSPDGSFSENSLSGGAATVALTNATTFTISCLDPNGNPVTDYVTVNLAI